MASCGLVVHHVQRIKGLRRKNAKTLCCQTNRLVIVSISSLQIPLLHLFYAQASCVKISGARCDLFKKRTNLYIKSVYLLKESYKKEENKEEKWVNK